MELKIKRDIRPLKDGTPPERAAEIMRELDRCLLGPEQHMKGLWKRNAAEGFLELFSAENRQTIEEQIATLGSLKDSTRFRTEALLTFVDMLMYGLAAAEFDEEFILKFIEWHKGLDVTVSIKAKAGDIPELA